MGQCWVVQKDRRLVRHWATHSEVRLGWHSGWELDRRLAKLRAEHWDVNWETHLGHRLGLR